MAVGAGGAVGVERRDFSNFFSMRTFGAALTAVCLGFSEDRGVVVGAVG